MMTEDEQLEKLMKPEYISSLTRLIELVKKLDNMGFLDVISGILSDEDTMKTIFGLITSDDVLSLTTKSDSIMAMLKIISEQKNIKALSNLLEIITVMQGKGLLDPIMGILNDDESMGAVMGLISNDFTMNLIMNNKLILNSLGTLDLSVTPHYVNMIKAIENAIKNETVTPVGGMMGTLHAMKDEDTQKGLGIVFSILKSLGKTCSNEFNCAKK
ncbi:MULTISPECIES: DUF1641 domain-containing protein [Acidiplasma]|jgi:uncharacterized protein YjgD (DUF1641 family)|uniref:DUF1641 domain-containing protein n=2 Tax=Acidiplasma TaxID=507753 RepID=A0A0Q0VW54_9ARCH|nr:MULTISPECIES: DUF1641 domain-containing protein [Acidiplasma]KJE48982.1 hypothetical protein TZ01_06905 [Acidiplasma sp. MBA-1]KPV47428.1 hypothetical protein SE19_01120 [Acidiplasma aeolicum]KQB35548.1 hypothetical protein AOG54_02935 [Acidiplasma aeolicum]KQB35864.1 hypothetical protein AOG55_05585 [Acidiplasma cupricumulans]WMT54410.1 MAG: DUF1641 domain-containing protein [Acidiplasma sp.]